MGCLITVFVHVTYTEPYSNYSGPYIIEPYYRSLIDPFKGNPILIIQ